MICWGEISAETIHNEVEGAFTSNSGKARMILLKASRRAGRSSMSQLPGWVLLCTINLGSMHRGIAITRIKTHINNDFHYPNEMGCADVSHLSHQTLKLVDKITQCDEIYTHTIAV